MVARYVAVLALISTVRLGAQACDSYRASATDSVIDLAPPQGFVEVCSRDPRLCSLLTAGFPPSVSTIGYFAAGADWNAFLKDSSIGLKHYLIAQVAIRMTPEQLPGFKAYLHSQQGSIPDHTRVPSVLADQGRVSLGIIAETPSSISFGTIMKIRPLTSENADVDVVVATNTAAVIKRRMLSLYVYWAYHTEADIDSTKALTQRWLQCLTKAN